MKKMIYQWLRPVETDVGRGPEPCRIQYTRRSGQVYELPPEGARVPWHGEEGLFWRRRLNDARSGRGGVELFTPSED